MSQNCSVTVHTTLPPSIIKPDPYFNLNLQINYIKWNSKITSNYEDVIVKVLWWGEETEGSIFIPRCFNLAGYKQNIRTHAVYPVCVPLNHFTTYLGDMDKLILEIIDSAKKSLIGRAVLEKLEQLTYNKELQSLCPIYNAKNAKIGEIMVILTLDSLQNNKNNSQSNTKPVTMNEIIDVNPPNESTKPKFVTDSSEKVDNSENVIDHLIKKSKKIRETISIDVKNDEINDAILRKKFPEIEDYQDKSEFQDKKWIKNMLIDGSMNDFSFNDISKINTESILRTSHNFSVDKRSNRNNTEDYRESIKLIAGSDSFCSDSVGDFGGKYRFLSNSEANLLKKLDKDVSSDDDPLKHDSIIEELFYKQPESVTDMLLETEVHKNKSSTTELVSSIRVEKPDQRCKDFEIYQSLSQHNNIQNNIEEINSVFNREIEKPYEDDHMTLNDDIVGGDWYRNISSIKVYLDMLWLNSCLQPSNRNARSRSQSSNYSSDREKCRRSCDSGSSFNNSSTSFSVSKPPTPQVFQFNPAHKYFIDYKFPSNEINGTDRDKENVSFLVSTVRVAVKLTGSSCNLTEPNKVKSISLDHVAEFPVFLINNSVIQKWWKGIIRFKLISLDTSKKETVVGVGIVPLRNVISANNFYRLIPIRVPRNKNTKTKTRVVIGSLAMRTSMVMTPTKVFHSSEKRSETSFRSFPESRNETPYVTSKSSNLKNTAQSHPNRLPSNSYSRKSLRSIHSQSRSAITPTTSSKFIPIDVESFLQVSSIRYVNPKLATHGYQSETKSYNLYFIGRLLWVPNHKIKSRIIWGTSKASESLSVNELESFKLSETSLFTLTPEIMEKLKNNYAILEVWDISTDQLKNSLFGLVKIPLNIFHMSFKNEKIRKTILNNVYPLLSSDDWLNIEDPISGTSKGQVHVLLAVGTPQQIENLKLSKENTFNGHWNRNFLSNSLLNHELVEHIIDVSIESLRNFSLENYSDSSSKETYFYVQYYFPLQNSISDNNGKNWESSIFRSINNLIQSSVDISDANRHRFRLPLDCSLKTMLSKHFDVSGKRHVLFELHVKQYSPFPSSRCVAKGRLQISSLFQLINQHSVDMDSLADTLTQQQIPVRLQIDDEIDSNNTVGVLNVRLSYRTKVIQNVVRQQLSNNNSPYDQPIVRIEILSATGLQFAIESLVETHPELQYPSVTGINSHVKFWLTDESNKQSRIYVNTKGIQKFQFNSTKTVARTFTPKFDHICEILLGPIIDDETSNSLYKTLAEKIICGIYQLNVEVYHDVFNSIYSDINDTSSTSKILVGKGRISLADLLLRSSGFMGPIWIPVFSPMDSDSAVGGCKLNIPTKKKFDSLYSIEKRKSVGAVEVRLGFLDKSDRNTILQLAMDAGFVVPWTNRLETEDLTWQQMDLHGFTFKNISVNIEEMELSEKLLNSIFTPEAGFQKSSIKVLARYRMYKHAVSSSLNFLLNEDEVSGKVYIPINHEEKYCYRVSSDLFRYLRESKLEVQIWAIYGSSAMLSVNNSYEQNENLNDVRLLGSASFDLSSLILPCDQQEKSVRHILPLWKRGVSNCGNSNVTVTVNISGSLSPMANYHSDNDDEFDTNRPLMSQNPSRRPGNVHKIRTDNQQSFPVHILIEKAVNLKSIPFGNENINGNDMTFKPLNYFVSFPCTEENKSVHSSIVKGNKEVVWNFECDTRLPYNLLTDNNSTLDFKIYSSVSESEQTGEILDEKILIGIVKLDLSLLLKGFERVIGWYNIADLQGDCQGQIKVGVTPMVPLVPNTAVLSKNTNPKVHQSPSSKPLTIEDHQSYLSSVRMRLLGQTQRESDIPMSLSTENKVYQESDHQDIMSKSLLFDTLKEKLKELDVLNETFKKKMENNDNCNKTATVNEIDGGIKSLQCTTSMIPIEKIDYGTNTENENFTFRNENCNNNNCAEGDIFNRNEYESDERDELEFSEDGSENENDNFGTCINELDPCKSFESNSHKEIEYHGVSVCDHPDGDRNSNHDSESEDYTTSFCEIKDHQSIHSSRSSSPYSHIEETKANTSHPFQMNRSIETEKDEFDAKSNDSWDETVVPTSYQHGSHTSPISNRQPVQKPINVRTTIPKFFPQSFDFQEKLKTIKINLENNSKIYNVPVKEKLETDGHSGKPNQIVNITDDEASRISRIFGIRKP